jgi:hypothetical protein
MDEIPEGEWYCKPCETGRGIEALKTVALKENKLEEKKQEEEAEEEEEEVVVFSCTKPGCKYTSAKKSSVSWHEVNEHDTDSKKILFKCKHKGCRFKAPTEIILKKHVDFIHAPPKLCGDADDSMEDGSGVVLSEDGMSAVRTALANPNAPFSTKEFTYECKIGDCDWSKTVTFKRKSSGAADLTRHQARAHDVNVTWVRCDLKGCEYKCRDERSLLNHQLTKHPECVKCTAPGCKFKTYADIALQRHMAETHDDEGREWMYCDEAGCEYRAKHEYLIKDHKAIHAKRKLAGLDDADVPNPFVYDPEVNWGRPTPGGVKAPRVAMAAKARAAQPTKTTRKTPAKRAKTTAKTVTPSCSTQSTDTSFTNLVGKTVLVPRKYWGKEYVATVELIHKDVTFCDIVFEEGNAVSKVKCADVASWVVDGTPDSAVRCTRYARHAFRERWNQPTDVQDVAAHP